MRAAWAMTFCTSVVAAGLASCARPVVTIRHDLPRAVPLPAGTTALRAGAFTLRGMPNGAMGVFTREALQEKLAAMGLGGAGATTAPGGQVDVEVGGVIDVKVADQRGTRKVLRRNAQDGEMVPVELASLVRTVRVDVRFQMTRPDGGELGSVETRRSYLSTADPRVRGELGLHRPDDPQHVPPAEEIVRPLLVQCVDGFAGMIAPVAVRADVPLRAVAFGRGAEGIKAAEGGDLTAAQAHFQAAHDRAPGDRDVLFDLAVVREAVGQLPAALKHYEEIVRLTQGRDRDAAEGAKRVRRVIERLGAATK